MEFNGDNPSCYKSAIGIIESISHGNEEMLFNVISFIDKRDEARVFFSKEEIVRRATCKFVRNFHPPPALVPSRREKRDTGTDGGREGQNGRDPRRRRRAGERRGTRRKVEEGGCFLFLARGDLCARNRAGNETSRGKRVEGGWRMDGGAGGGSR